MNFCDNKKSIQRWTFLRRYSTTEKQALFISLLLDLNGYRNSPMKETVLRTIGAQCYNAFYASINFDRVKVNSKQLATIAE
jgi:hypothetical protein